MRLLKKLHLSVPTVVPQSDPVFPTVGFIGEKLVNMLEEEASVEGGWILEPDATDVGVPAGKRPRHKAVAP
jgi:hypothetical protein